MENTLIICAMEEELSVLYKKWNLADSHKEPWPIYKHPKKPLYATISGVGKVNAAGCLANAIMKINPSQIIGIGVAGAVDPEIKIGDIVISKKFVQHDMDVTVFGYKLGQIPGFNSPYFEAASSLRKTAEIITAEAENYSSFTGTIMTGDSFIKDQKGKDLHELFTGLCVDMESAAWAQIAIKYNLPILVLRCISDQADGNAPENYQRFLKKAVTNLSTLVENIINMKVR